MYREIEFLAKHTTKITYVQKVNSFCVLLAANVFFNVEIIFNFIVKNDPPSASWVQRKVCILFSTRQKAKKNFQFLFISWETFSVSVSLS